MSLETQRKLLIAAIKSKNMKEIQQYFDGMLEIVGGQAMILSPVDASGDTLLHILSRMRLRGDRIAEEKDIRDGLPSIFNRLLEAGLTADVTNEKGETPRSLARSQKNSLATAAFTAKDLLVNAEQGYVHVVAQSIAKLEQEGRTAVVASALKQASITEPGVASVIAARITIDAFANKVETLLSDTELHTDVKSLLTSADKRATARAVEIKPRHSTPVVPVVEDRRADLMPPKKAKKRKSPIKGVSKNPELPPKFPMDEAVAAADSVVGLSSSVNADLDKFGIDGAGDKTVAAADSAVGSSSSVKADLNTLGTDGADKNEIKLYSPTFGTSDASPREGTYFPSKIRQDNLKAHEKPKKPSSTSKYYAVKPQGMGKEASVPSVEPLYSHIETMMKNTQENIDRSLYLGQSSLNDYNATLSTHDAEYMDLMLNSVRTEVRLGSEDKAMELMGELVTDYALIVEGQINTLVDGVTLLHLAADKGYTALMKRIVELGGDVNALDESGNSALHRAIRDGHEDVVSALLSLNADTRCEGFGDLSPLASALIDASSFNPNIVKALLDKDPSVLLTMHIDASVSDDEEITVLESTLCEVISYIEKSEGEIELYPDNIKQTLIVILNAARSLDDEMFLVSRAVKRWVAQHLDSIDPLEQIVSRANEFSFNEHNLISQIGKVMSNRGLCNETDYENPNSDDLELIDISDLSEDSDDDRELEEDDIDVVVTKKPESAPSVLDVLKNVSSLGMDVEDIRLSENAMFLDVNETLVPRGLIVEPSNRVNLQSANIPSWGYLYQTSDAVSRKPLIEVLPDSTMADSFSIAIPTPVPGNTIGIAPVPPLPESFLSKLGRGIGLALVTLGAIVAGAVLYPATGALWLLSIGIVSSPIIAVDRQRTNLVARWSALIRPAAVPPAVPAEGDTEVPSMATPAVNTLTGGLPTNDVAVTPVLPPLVAHLGRTLCITMEDTSSDASIASLHSLSSANENCRILIRNAAQNRIDLYQHGETMAMPVPVRLKSHSVESFMGIAFGALEDPFELREDAVTDGMRAAIAAVPDAPVIVNSSHRAM